MNDETVERQVLRRDVYMPIVQTKRSPAGFGLNAARHDLLPVAAQLGAGWFYDWWVRVDVPRLRGAEYVQMVGVNANGPTQGYAHLTQAARANPGMVWFVGNEVDVADQNGMTPEQYAVVYHDVRSFILDADWSATVAVGSLRQFSPLRRVWLERWIAEYRNLYGHEPPVEIWNTHAYNLPDDAPVGVTGQPGPWQDWQHADPELFASQLVELRSWLDSVGYATVPIWVSEFGVLWDTVPPEQVRSFMVSTFDWLEWSGVVERWAWFCLHEVDGFNAAGALVTEDGLTETGRVYAEVTSG